MVGLSRIPPTGVRYGCVDNRIHPLNKTCILAECHILKHNEKKCCFSNPTLNLNLNLEFWCLLPLSAIFQLYHGDQF